MISSNAITNLKGSYAVAAGEVGELIESRITSAADYPATGVRGDATSIDLTPGQWDITSFIYASKNGSTIAANASFELAISTTSGNSTSGLILGVNWNASKMPSTSITELSFGIGPYSVTIDSTTTYYMKVRAVYTANPNVPTYLGTIRARRVK